MDFVTPEVVAATSSDDDLFQLLGRELERRLPNGRQATDEFVQELRSLPLRLRSMAATFELDVSLTMDDLGWHFGNWHHEGLAEETALGLEELGATRLAEIFREAFRQALVFWAPLGCDDWMEWYHGSALEESVHALNTEAWALQNERGILELWPLYARKHPERLV
ncbi:MAG: DMP19 family protein [Lacipirellulaceae bacterium]